MSAQQWLAAVLLPGVVWAAVEFAQFSAAKSLTAVSVLCLLLASCAVVDTVWKKIPNWATYSAFLWALVLSAAGARSGITEPNEPAEWGSMFLSQFPVPIGDALAGAVVCFLIMLMIHSTSKGGAGDVKLATAIGALLGVKLGVLAICYTFIVAGVVSLGIAIWVLGPVFIGKACGRWVGSLFLPLMIDKPNAEQSKVLQKSLPLGVFFALGTLLAILDLPGVNL